MRITKSGHKKSEISQWKKFLKNYWKNSTTIWSG